MPIPAVHILKKSWSSTEIEFILPQVFLSPIYSSRFPFLILTSHFLPTFPLSSLFLLNIVFPNKNKQKYQPQWSSTFVFCPLLKGIGAGGGLGLLSRKEGGREALFIPAKDSSSPQPFL